VKKTTVLLVSIFQFLISYSQTPGINWQRTIGGSQHEEIFFNVKTVDNAIIIIGQTFSTDGGFNNHGGNVDIWVEKLSLNGVTQWRRTLGGSDNEDLNAYYYNTDGTLLIASTTSSSDGDVTGNHDINGTSDIWVVKLDINGNIIWQRSYGGTDSEEASKLTKAPDGNYVLTGLCSSLNGDVTGYHGGIGEPDLWVVKFNESGTIIWQKALGGTAIEQNYSTGPPALAPDGSIYVLANTDSNDGDVTGPHAQTDIWLIKLDAAGNIVWQKSLGGNGYDYGVSVNLAPSGEIYIAGSVFSTELPGFHGTDPTYCDIYFCRVSPAGNLLFEKCLGTSSWDNANIISIDNANKPIFSAGVQAGDGDVIGRHGTGINNDIWIFKTDINANIEWQSTIGGSGDDFIVGMREDLNFPSEQDQTAYGNIIPTIDGGYLFTAFTDSHDGDITGFHDGPSISPDFTICDLWVVKLNANGQIQYTRSLGGSRFELPAPPVEIGFNDFVITGNSDSRDGDIQTNAGDFDGWVVRFTSVNRIKGTVFVDNNGNGIKDSGDSLFSNVVIKATKGADVRSVIPYNGSFLIETDTGSYNTTLTLHLPYYTVTPVSHTSNFSTYFNTDSFSFALQPIPGSKDLVINAIPVTVARPGFNVNYVINYKNAGVQSEPSGEILFKKDSRLTLLSAVPAVSSTVGDTLKWSYTGFDPQEQGIINLQFKVAAPPSVNAGDTLHSLAIITPVAGDVTPHDDTSILNQRVVGAVDPNDKAENVGGSITLDRVLQGEYLSYFVRFQNTGTDTAFNVVVRDTLETDLDWNTFEMIASSHAYQLQLLAPNILEWTFYGINLPDSNVNEPASHGYVAYRIKLAAGASIGTTVLNRASIYFDFNLPVPTNFAATIVGTPIPLPLHLLNFDANYQKPDAFLRWSTADEVNVDKFIIERGTDPIHFVQVGTVAAKRVTGVTQYQFKDGLASINGDKFYYRLKLMDQDQKFSYSNIQMVRREGRTVNELVINPNPIKGRFGYAWINLNKETRAEIGVVDMKGNYRSLGQQQVSKGFNVVPLDFFGLSAGTYLLEVKIGQERLVSRFVLVH
jgi:uncharacterized repeat protein (TIGR01451 family)